jgi:flagellar hook-associated protein 1 FlgK
VQPGGGKLGGILEARDSVISGVLASLDEIAVALIEQVNAVHATGYGLDGSTGLCFFEGTSAATIRMSADVEDVTRLATAAEDSSNPGNPTGPGDGSIALAIAQIADLAVLNGGTVTIGDHYQMMIGRIGLQASHAEANLSASETMVAHLQDRREQVSGVSLDEEAANMIRYQRAYQAAAKMITVIDQMIETLLNMGLVGR